MACQLQLLHVLSLAMTAVLLSSQGKGADATRSTLRLEREDLAPYIDSNLELNLRDVVRLLCPNTTVKHRLYHLFADQFDNCTEPEDRNFLIGDCTDWQRELILKVTPLSSTLSNLPNYVRGGTHYYGLYSSIGGVLSNEPCRSGLKFSIHIRNLNNPTPTSSHVWQSSSTSTPAATTSLPTATTVPAEPTGTASTAGTAGTASSRTDLNVPRPTRLPLPGPTRLPLPGPTRLPPTSGVSNSSPFLRFSLSVVVLTITLIALVL